MTVKAPPWNRWMFRGWVGECRRCVWVDEMPRGQWVHTLLKPTGATGTPELWDG